MNFAFKPTRFEEEWLPVYLESFAKQDLFISVLYRVKGGKEATVYCCEAHPSTGLSLLAAKVYRPLKFRTMRNDALYREGTEVLDGEGKAVRDTRSHRALKKKTRFGRELKTFSWLQREYQTMEVLYKAGADIPQPLACGENAVLMAYRGDESQAAPTLHEVRLADDEAPAFFDRLLWNITLFLVHDRIHADLSAFNTLYWNDRLTLIDFPQTVDARTNPNAFNLLYRDIERVCQYFGRYEVASDPLALAEDLWKRYSLRELVLEQT